VHIVIDAPALATLGPNQVQAVGRLDELTLEDEDELRALVRMNRNRVRARTARLHLQPSSSRYPSQHTAANAMASMKLVVLTPIEAPRFQHAHRCHLTAVWSRGPVRKNFSDKSNKIASCRSA